jgi:bifunctional non-homologous end joining protein LigD
MATKESLELHIDSRVVKLSSPNRVIFPEQGITKMQLAEYYQMVGVGALRGVKNRPFVMKRFPDGVTSEFFFQKRAPPGKPDWVQTTTLNFPSGRTAEEVVITDVAGLVWVVNLGCIDLNPHAIRASDVLHPDELRVDLDPGEGVTFDTVKQVAHVVHQTLNDFKMKSFPKTSGSRGIHINIRIEPKWDFIEVRRAAVALAREVERRAPELCTTKWWKEERHGVFIDYNQNAKDKTVASVYSVRPTPDAKVSAPFFWEELPDIALERFTVKSMPERWKAVGDVEIHLDDVHHSLLPLLDLASQDEAKGLTDAPWPPHYAKQDGEGKRVAPSRAKKEKPKPAE